MSKNNLLTSDMIIKLYDKNREFFINFVLNNLICISDKTLQKELFKIIYDFYKKEPFKLSNYSSLRIEYKNFIKLIDIDRIDIKHKTYF